MNYKMKKLAAMKLIEKMDEIDPDAIKAFSISIMLKDDMSDEEEDMLDEDMSEEDDSEEDDLEEEMEKS
jgi:hypothetical protein